MDNSTRATIHGYLNDDPFSNTFEKMRFSRRVPSKFLGTLKGRDVIDPISVVSREFRCSSRRWNLSTSSISEKLPPFIPSAGCVNLTPLRSLLAIHGPDAAKFLQGLVTKIFPSETERDGMFTAFLSPQVLNAFQKTSDSRDEFFSKLSFMLAIYQ